MANPEDTGPDSRNAKKPTPTELKKELEKLINLILNEDDYAVQELNKAICILSSLKEKNVIENETTDEAIRVVSSLRELKIKELVPKEFKRPMSEEIMGEPVLVASGQDKWDNLVHTADIPAHRRRGAVPPEWLLEIVRRVENDMQIPPASHVAV